MRIKEFAAIIIILIALNSCSVTNIKDKVGVVDLSPKSNEDYIVELGNQTLLDKDYYSNYKNFNFIHTTEGVDREKIIGIVRTINPDYFNGISELEVIYSNPEARLDDKGGWYYSDNNKITIYDYNYSSGLLYGMILHELKHHYCWLKFKDLSHDKCFLDTPIDKEYGQIK